MPTLSASLDLRRPAPARWRLPWHRFNWRTSSPRRPAPTRRLSRGGVVTLITGGSRSGRERKFYALPTGDEAAVARTLGSLSQPRVPPSAASPTPPAVACKNLRRVNLGFKSPPLSRYYPGLRANLLELRKLHHFRSLFARSASGIPPGRSRNGAELRYPTTRLTSRPGT
jgi:hypothetical protein